MAILQIPTKGGVNAPNFNFRVSLDGNDYDFRFRYNDRSSEWSISIYDKAGVSIRDGVSAVVNFPLTRLIADLRKPPGFLYFFDSRGHLAAPPTLDQIAAGGTALLVYSEAE